MPKMRAQSVQRMLAQSRQFAPRQFERTDDFCFERGERRQPGAIKFGIQKRHIESRVVNHNLAAAQKIRQRRGDLRKARLARQPLARPAVNALGLRIDFALGIEQRMKLLVFGPQPALRDFERRHFDDAMAARRIDSGCFGVEKNQRHCVRAESRAKASAT